MKFSTTMLALVLAGASAVAQADYRAGVLDDRPAVYWSFDESDGARAPSATALAAPARREATAAARRGMGRLAATFDAAHRRGRVEVPLDAKLDQAVEQILNGSFSLELWLLDEAGPPDGKTNYSLFYKADQRAFTRNSIWLYRARQDGHYRFYIDGQAGRRAELTVRNPAGERAAGDGAWHHLVIAVDRTSATVRAYLDGKLAAESACDAAAAISNDGPLIVGNNPSHSSPWQGSIDELAIYSRALPLPTVVRHFHTGRSELARLDTARPTAAQEEFFELKIRPLLVEKCGDCHNGDADAESALALNSRQALVEGGDFGPAVIPGRAGDSLLIQAVKRIHKELRMPPDDADALSRDQIAALSRWIDEGAPWPGGEVPAMPDQDEPAGQPASPIQPSSGHWAFAPRRVVLPPQVDDARWQATPIDRFVEHARREKGLSAAGVADRRTLIRRATFDLTGLPPTPEAVDAFLADPAPLELALGRVVEGLLASPHYGERQGRAWLDVARYADTQGDVGDFPIPTAYRYRNWVIDALNADMPFDAFLRAQIAGDILARDEPDEATARGLVVATGFVALSRRFGNKKRDDLHLTIEDTIDTIGRGVLGLTVRCARCHDHKFDPIAAADYYALYGIFESTTYPWLGMSDEKSPSNLAPALPSEKASSQAEAYWSLIGRYEYQINNHHRPWLKPTLDEFRDVRQQLAKLREGGGATGDDADESPDVAQRVVLLEARRDALLARHDGKFRELMLHDLNWLKREKQRLAENPPVELVFAVSEGRPHDARLHRRGNPQRPGPVIPRGFPRVIDVEGAKIARGSGRLELAQWLTRDEHPLVPRVIVNRIWQQHFGRGLVSTADNFGKQGTPPSHPELLDHLAEQFVRDGWSLKKLHRRIMLSETYRLAWETSAANEAADADNRYLWQFARRRLDAEQIRDAMLATSGRLDRSPAGAHPFQPWHAARFSLNRPFHEEFPSNHRSVYLMTQRLFPHPFLGLFDGPDTNSSTSKRDAMNTPGQALFLMNSPFVNEQAQALAARVTAEAGGDEPRQAVTRLYRLAYGRDVAAEEWTTIEHFLDRYQAAARDVAGDDDVGRRALVALCRAVLTSNEFFYID